jgi:hypothetical protein
MSEQLSCPVLILSDDEDDDMEEGQQQEAGEDREQEAYNHGTSSNGDVDDDSNRLQDNNESEGLQTTKHVWMDSRLLGMHIELDNSKQILFIMHYTSILKRPFEMN